MQRLRVLVAEDHESVRNILVELLRSEFEVVGAVIDGEQLVKAATLLQPDVIVKGGDYSPDTVVGADEVRARGGNVVIIPLTPGHSTTSTIDRLRGR